jgi:hypothetical protein
LSNKPPPAFPRLGPSIKTLRPVSWSRLSPRRLIVCGVRRDLGPRPITFFAPPSSNLVYDEL